METDPVSETLCFLISRIPDEGQNPKIPVILRIFADVGPELNVSYIILYHSALWARVYDHPTVRVPLGISLQLNILIIYFSVL
jgi:hypothetical protein